MRKKLFTILIVFAFLTIGSFSMMLYIRADIKEAPDYNEIGDLEGVSGTPNLKGKTYEGLDIDTGNTWTVSVSDDYNMTTYYQDFECVLEGDRANIWIGLASDVWDGGYQDYYYNDDNNGYGPGDVWYFAYPWTAEGIPNDYADLSQGYYLQPEYHDWITYEDLEYIMEEFDQENGIHDTVVSNFGEYAVRPGPLEDNKTQILIFNIRDGLFFDPETAPWFIMGYFWSFISNTNDANIFHMDTYQWWRRLGDDPILPYPYQDYTPLPNQYEGTFAHEFQHLVHYDVDPDEFSWVDEGCATLAEWLCGYGFSPGHISEYLMWFWDTPLTIWEGYLADYGASFLWTYYMYEHYGGEPNEGEKGLIWDLVHDEDNGIKGWNNVLEGRTDKTFDDIFQDWAIANYLDNVDIAEDGIYGYYELDIPSADSGGESIQSSMAYWDSAYKQDFDFLVGKYPTFGAPYPYGDFYSYVVNYVEFSMNGIVLVDFAFDGDDFCGALPNGVYNWYSGGEAWSWFRLGHNFSIPETGASLTFWNSFSIEADWDYGYVEVYDTDTGEWYTLPGTKTTSTLPNAEDNNNPNCPDDVEPLTYFAAERWNAFTGDSGGMYTEVMDLTPFAGKNITLFFTYWSDGYVLGSGWYVDDIEIPELSYIYDVEEADPTWTVNTGWHRNDEFAYNDFEASFINIMNTRGESYYDVFSMDLDDDTEEGSEELFLIGIKPIFETISIFVVANQPGYEHTFKTSYSFEALALNKYWRYRLLFR